MKIQYSSFKKILLTFFLLTGVLVSAGNYHIDGYVVVEDYYYAVSNEMVNIHDQNGTLIFSTITDNNGYYSGDFSADTSFVTVVVNRFCDGELTTYSKAIQLDDSVLTCSFLVCKEEPCDVYFNWAQQSASSLSIAFEALSMSEITSWIWDFGDGNFSGEENPVHEYDAEGLYIVQLFVTGPCGPRSFNDQVLVVYHGNCMAEFSYDPVASGTNYVYQFHDQSTGEITEWSWEFGGVGFSNQQNPMFDLQTPGPHFVNLQIFGNQCVDVKSKFIIVEPASTCFPHFNYNQLLGTYTLSFADLSISDSLNGWLWDFGDGYTGDQQNPTPTTLREFMMFRLRLTDQLASIIPSPGPSKWRQSATARPISASGNLTPVCRWLNFKIYLRASHPDSFGTSATEHSRTNYRQLIHFLLPDRMRLHCI